MSSRGRGGGRFGPPKHAFIDAKGYPGVLVMCMQGKEEQALREAAALMTEYSRRVYPALFPSLAASSAAEALPVGGAGDAGGASTVADEIAAELAELAGEQLGSAGAGGKKRRREDDAAGAADGDASRGGGGPPTSAPVPIRTAFVCRAVGVLWWSGAAAAQVDPCAVVDTLCEQVAASKQSCGRFLDRLLPLQRIVRCDMEEVLAAARALLGSDIEPPPGAPLPGDSAAPGAPPSVAAEAGVPGTAAAAAAAAAAPPRTWSAEVRIRNTDAVSRPLLTAGLGDLMRRRFRVDLNGGSHTIVVEACMSIAGVSVVRGGAFWRHARYNVRLLAETDAEREARIHASNAAAAAAAAKKTAAAAAAAAAEAPARAPTEAPAPPPVAPPAEEVSPAGEVSPAEEALPVAEAPPAASAAGTGVATVDV